MAVQPGPPGSDPQLNHVRAVHAANARHDPTGHIAAAHARNHIAPGSVADANIIKTQDIDPSVPRDYNEPTRKYSKPKIPGKND